MSERQTAAEMAGGWLREASVLVLVFGLLDKLIHDELTVGWTAGVVALALVTFAIGVAIEQRRR